MNRFFVYHPVFAWVIALFIALFGLIAVRSLPIEQYPAVAPPSLNLEILYNGADAETLDRNATSIISKEINGVDNFLYMSATSRANGTAEIVVTFKPGTNLDIARTQVQDRLSRVTPRLRTFSLARSVNARTNSPHPASTIQLCSSALSPRERERLST